MKFMIGEPEPGVERPPDWDVYAEDAFGRPGHLIGGLMGMAATKEDAAALFIEMWPDYAGTHVWIGPSRIAPPWPMPDRA